MGTPAALWLAGFRPFFALACLSGLGLPVLWVLMLRGVISLPFAGRPGAFSMIQWHAHEMLFGFGWAVLGGFLLTSTKNWVKQRGYHGNALALLVAAWLFERLGMAVGAGGAWPFWLFALSNNLFLASIIVMLLLTLLRHRRDDTYRLDNLYFLVVLPAFLIAKHLLLGASTFALGASVTIGLFRMAFLVMLERTLTQFMQSALGVTLLRRPLLDHAIKGLGVLLIAESALPSWLVIGIAALFALLISVRFVAWKPHLGLRRLELAVMYLGYLGILAQVLLLLAGRLGQPAWVGSVAVHVFAFGVMGIIIPAMLVRICNGHTGRKVVFTAVDRLALWVMLLGFGLRIVAPQLAPTEYPLWLALSAACWFVCFGVLGWRYVPYLLRPRVDGKEH